MTNEQIVNALNQIVFNYRYAIRQPSKHAVQPIESLRYIIGFLKMNAVEITFAGDFNLLEQYRNVPFSSEVTSVDSKIKEVKAEKSKAIDDKDYERASWRRDDERKLFEQLNIKILKEGHGHDGPFYLMKDNSIKYILDQEDELYSELKSVLFHIPTL